MRAEMAVLRSKKAQDDSGTLQEMNRIQVPVCVHACAHWTSVHGIVCMSTEQTLWPTPPLKLSRCKVKAAPNPSRQTVSWPSLVQVNTCCLRSLCYSMQLFLCLQALQQAREAEALDTQRLVSQLGMAKQKLEAARHVLEAGRQVCNRHM